MNVQATILNANPETPLIGSPKKKCCAISCYGVTKIALCGLSWVTSGACIYLSAKVIIGQSRAQEIDAASVVTATITMLFGLVLCVTPFIHMYNNKREVAVTTDSDSYSDYFELP